MTSEIMCALRGGPDSSEFMRLLDNFGIWCRFSGCSGYHNSGESESYVLTDDSAMELDRAMVCIRNNHKLGFWLFKQYYICGRNTVEIAVLMNQYGRKKRDVAMTHASSKSVDKLLNRLRGIIFNLLSEEKSASVYL